MKVEDGQSTSEYSTVLSMTGVSIILKIYYCIYAWTGICTYLNSFRRFYIIILSLMIFINYLIGKWET